MKRIMFVCHGNICRSPMAEFIMRDLIRQRGLSDRIETFSAATSREEIGNPVYPPVRKLLAERGISCSGKTAVQLTLSDYEKYDYFIGMDEENRYNMVHLFHGDPENKVSLLLDHTDHPRDVADPWYTRDFREAQSDIDEGCAALLEELTKP